MFLREAPLLMLVTLASALAQSHTFAPLQQTVAPLQQTLAPLQQTFAPLQQTRALPIVSPGPPTPTTFTKNTQFNDGSAAAAGVPPPIQSYSPEEIKSFKRISLGAQKFALELFAQFSDEVSSVRTDIMISPFAIWSLMLLLVEGADGETEKQLRATLHLDNEQQSLRRAYHLVQTFLTTNTSTIEVASLQALFSDENQPIQRDYEQTIERDYGAALIPVNFHDPNATYIRINIEVNKATRGLIPYAVQPQDLNSANLLMLSALFFKGQWNKPFNRSLTRTEPFYDVDGNNIGDVQMMVQEGNFVFAGITELEGHVLELPYGKEGRLSMLVILPKKGVSLNKVAHNLKDVGFERIFARLKESEINFEDEDVEVFLPRWSTSSGFNLNGILQTLGINDVFDSVKADLSKMASNFYVSNIIHHTQIIVNEEGTTAAASTSAVFANKATPPKFYLNRPFLYLIMEKSTNLLLFAGQVENPNKIRQKSK